MVCSPVGLDGVSLGDGEEPRMNRRDHERRCVQQRKSWVVRKRPVPRSPTCSACSATDRGACDQGTGRDPDPGGDTIGDLPPATDGTARLAAGSITLISA